MTTQINVTIGDQRLLQNSKTRAAANQQTLDDRQQKAKTKDKATTAVEQTAERRNAVPENAVDRRPAAQRRKKKEEVIIFAGLQRRDPFTLLGSEQSGSTTWQAPYTLSNVWTEKPILNFYNTRTTRIQPLLNQVFPTKTESYETTPVFDVTLRTDSLDWTIRQYFFNASASPTRKDGAPPAFPLDWTQLKKFTNFRSMVMSCTETTIYLSQGFRVYYAPPSFLNGINDPNFYQTPTFPGQTTQPVPGAYLRKIDGQIFGDASEYVYIDFAIYRSYNVKTKTQTTRELDITAYSSASKSFPYLTFYQNLNAADPHANLFSSYINTYSPSAQASAAAFYSVSSWPASLRYNKATGELLVFADSPPGYTGSLRSLMRRTIDPNLSYTAVKALLPPTPPFTRSVLEANGFAFVTDYNISAGSSLYDQVFPVVSNG